VAENATIVFLCVTGSKEVEELIFAADGLSAGARHDLIIVDTSTSDPTSTERIATALANQGVTFVDAPLARTPREAEAGTLDTMVGCDEATLARLKPVLQTWAARITHVGPVGNGHKLKLINNFIAMGYAAIYAEALALGKKVGIEPQLIDSVIRDGRMSCGFYNTFMQYVLERDREAHAFTLRNALKDMRYVDAMANAAGLANPIGNAVKNGFAIAVNIGRGEDYVPMLSDIVAELNGTSLV
jgi:3-hydroxyisobutyrate dehydrogenase-like beta-hydroxyacid dehydrogenase